MIKLFVNGREFSGWKSARVTRGIESIAGSFGLEVSERWGGQTAPWEIAEEDECELWIDQSLVISGYVDRRTLSYGPSEHSLGISGRDKTGALVDCSAALSKWEFKGVDVLTFVKRVCEPFGIVASLQSGVLPGAAPAKLTVDPGDTAFEAIEKACRLAGLLPISDGAGGLVLTRAGASRVVTALVQGENILSASAEYDATGRFATYKVLGQHKGTDEFSGAPAATVKGTATDSNVRRTERVLIVRPEGNVTSEQAKVRAQWEAGVRAGRGDSVTVTVQGWTMGNGALWPVNALVSVRSPGIGVNGDLLITQATYSIDEGGTTTVLALRNPRAFLPESVVAKTTGGKGSNFWKEIVGGV